MWLLILHYDTILCFYFTFLLLLRSPRDKFYNLKSLIWFNYNPPSIIITVFETESFHLLNWKVPQLKCISLIKLTSNLNTLFLLEWNIFTGKRVKMNDEDSAQKAHKRCTKKCTKGSFIVLIFMSVITLFFCFISFLFDYQWNSKISSKLKPFFKFFTVLFYFIKTN